MELLKIVFLSLGALLTLFISTKIMGNREISQLNMFDYVIGITIGSIAAEMATSLESNFMQPLVAIIVCAVVDVILSVSACKSLKLRRIITGKSYILLDNGELYRKNFSKAKLDLNEFLVQCRSNGFFSLSDIQTAILEPNGKVSFLPNSQTRPATPSDLNISTEQSRISVNVILDGIILKENLYYTGNDEIWLQKQLVSQGFKNESEIFLATCDSNNNLSVYKVKNIKNTHDFFE